MKYLTPILLVGLLIAATPLIWPRFQNNQLAIETKSTCFDLNQGLQISQQATQQAWFHALQLHCQGDSPEETSAWQAAVVQSPGRISLLRAARPDDLELAAYAAQAHPTEPSAQFWYAENLQSAGDTQATIEAYQMGLSLDPTNGSAWMVLGLLLEDQGDLSGAVSAYDQACRYVDKGKNGCPSAGRLYLQLGDYEGAKRSYRRSLLQLPGWLPAQRGMVKALFAQGRTQDAMPYLQNLAQSGDPEAIQTLQELQSNP